MVEDPLSSRFYRLGKLEYAFASLLDGKTTLRDVYARFSQFNPDHHLTENDAIALCRWLVEMELASSASKIDTNRQSKLAEKVQQKEVWEEPQSLNVRIPLWHPMRRWSCSRSGWDGSSRSGFSVVVHFDGRGSDFGRFGLGSVF